MKGVEIDIPFEEKTTRVGVIMRIIYAIIYAIVAAILGFFVMYIFWPIQMLVMLILGKRLEILNKFIYGYYKWMATVLAYVYTTTDEKAPFFPSF